MPLIPRANFQWSSLSVGARPLQRGEFLVFSLKIGEKTYPTLATIETWLVRGAFVDVLKFD